MSYIQPDPEPENDPESITLPPETDEAIKEACTLKTADQLKTEIDTENEDGEDNVFIIEDTEQQVMDDNNMNAIADAVKATLASQPGKKKCFRFLKQTILCFKFLRHFRNLVLKYP